MLRGIDISSHQGDAGIMWPLVQPDRAAFVIVKATGGVYYQNEYYPAMVKAARALGAVVGHYHYAFEPLVRAHLPWGKFTATQEADAFCDYADVQPGEFVALDIEDRAIPAGTDLVGWVLAFAARVKERTGCVIFIYTFPSFATDYNLRDPRLSQFPLWWASYSIPYQDQEYEHTPPWKPAIWQWSGGTPVAGFNFPTDENIFYGSREELVALGKPGEVVAQTKPFQHAIGWLAPITDQFHWGDGSAGIVTKRQIEVYNDETGHWYIGRWDTDHGITWEDVTPPPK